MAIAPEFIAKLHDALVDRRVDYAHRLLDRSAAQITRARPSDPLACSGLVYLAQWVDLGYSDLAICEPLYTRLSQSPRGAMKLSDYLLLRIYESLRAFLAEDSSATIGHLEFVVRAEEELPNTLLLYLVHWWKGRAHRVKGEYEIALREIQNAKVLAEQVPAPAIIAGLKMQESWFVFQKGNRREALALLDEAEPELRRVGHAFGLAILDSARGRFARQSGNYREALEYFGRAIAVQERRYPNHPTLARALVNAAYVKRLIALDLRSRMKGDRARGAENAAYLSHCNEALEMLQRADGIYRAHRLRRGIGTARVISSQIHLDAGDIDKALEDASVAYKLGEEISDRILIARARILQAAIQNQLADDAGSETPEAARCATLAKQYSNEAVAAARELQDKRLLAHAYLGAGEVAAGEYFKDWQSAKEFAALADQLLGEDDRDRLFEDLRHLKARIMNATGISDTMRDWADGIVHGHTFQQISEEFAEIVIPRVWMREGKKVARVAKRLSISPKKVRRILQHTGHGNG